MKKRTLLMITAMAVLAFASCNKESCTKCRLKEYPTGIVTEKTFCGTNSEISAENNRLVQEANSLTNSTPGYTYTGGCD